ncbi:MAG: hypothetical protein PHN56_03340, partial [Candidatus Nanoarchaeia archaeon]|nr:hypothetical protein [Candidatus Nanoarchaeia archaeon]
MMSLNKKILLSLIFLALLGQGFSAEVSVCYYFNNMNGYVRTLDPAGVADLNVYMKCNVGSDPSYVYLNTITNASGYYTFYGKSAQLTQDDNGNLTAKCSLYSNDAKFVNPPIYSFILVSAYGCRTAGITQDIVYDYYNEVQSPTLVSPNSAITMNASKANVIVSMPRGKSCKVNDFAMTKSSSTTYEKTLDFVHGSNTLKIVCVDEWGRSLLDGISETINNDIQGPSINILKPVSDIGTTTELLVSTSDAISCSWNTTHQLTALDNYEFNTSISGITGTNFYFSVTCNDSFYNPTTIWHEVEVDQVPKIFLESPLGLVSSSAILNISSQNAVQCYSNYSANNMAQDGIYFTQTINNLNHGINIFNVSCLSALSFNSTLITINADVNSPVIQILSPKNMSYNSNIIWFNATANENVNSWIVNYNGTNSSLNINSSLVVEDGDYNLLLYAVDNFGNLGLNNSINFIVDTIAPSLEIISPNNFAKNNITQLINISVFDFHKDSVWFVNGSENISYSSPVLFNFSEGNNTLTVWANDSLGNMNNSSVIFEIDSVAPSLEIVSPNSFAKNNITQLLNISMFDLHEDSVWFVNGSKNITYIDSMLFNFSEGNNTLTVWANDSLGNLNTSSVSFEIDSVAPLIEILSPKNMSYNSNIVWFNATANENVNSWIVNYNSTNVSLNINSSLVVEDGDYNLLLYAVDNLGNVGLNNSINFIVDTIAPTLEIVSPDNFAKNNITQWLNISVTDFHKDSVWFFNGSENVTYIDSMLFNFSEGNNTLTVWANDSLGNLNTSSVSFEIDSVAPLIEILLPKNMSYNSNIVWFNATANENVNSWIVNYNGTNSSMNINSSLIVEDGDYNLLLYAVDNFGNVGLNNSINFIVDTIAPSLEIISPTNFAKNNITQLLNISVFDSHKDSIWFVNGSENISYSSPMLVNFLEGNNVLTVWANDSANNINSATVTFTIDSVLPKIILKSPLIPINTSSIFINITADELVTNCYLNGSEMGYDSENNYYWSSIDELNPGINSFNISCTDLIGNYNETLIEVFYDNMPPELIINSPINDSTILNSSVYFEVSSIDAESCSLILNDTHHYNLFKFGEIFNIIDSIVNGDYKAEFSCKDLAGNYDSSIIYFSVDGNYTPLEITINSPIDSNKYNYNPKLNISASNNPSSCNYSLNNSLNLSIDFADSYFIANPDYSQGLNLLDIYCYDGITRTHNQLGVNVDTINPQSEINFIEKINSANFILSGIFTDNLAIANVTYYYNNANLINSSFIAPYNYLWNVSSILDNSFINISAVAYDNYGNYNKSELIDVPVNFINNEPVAVLAISESEFDDVKILNASESYDSDSIVETVELNYSYYLSNSSGIYNKINLCNSSSNTCMWNTTETENVCYVGTCYLKTIVSDGVNNIDSNIIEYTFEGNDLVVQSLVLPQEVIANINYNLSSKIKNNGNNSAYVQVIYLDYNDVIFNDSFEISAGQIIQSNATNLNFSKGTHNITVAAIVKKEINNFDNSLTSFLQSYYAIEKLIIDSWAPDRAMPGSLITASVFIDNPLNLNYSLNNYPHSDFSAIFNPQNYTNFDLYNNLYNEFYYDFTIPVNQQNYSFWANSLLQGENIEISSNNESINLILPKSPILSTELRVSPKINNIQNSTVT